MTVFKRRIKYSLYTLLFFSQILLGQSKIITLDSAIDLALKNNRSIQVAKLEVEKSEAAVKEAFGYALPTVDLNANFSRFLEKPKISFPDFNALLNNSTYDLLFKEGVLPEDKSKLLPVESVLQAFVDKNNYSIDLNASQILFNAAVFRGIGASEIYLNLSKEKLKSEISKTILNVKKTFYGTLLARDLLEITKNRFENAQEHLQNIKALKQQGLVSEFNEMQAEVQVENLRPILIKMENVYKDAKNGLKILLKIDQSQNIQINGQLAYIENRRSDQKKIIATAVNDNFNLRTLKIKNELDEEFASIDRGNYWPTIAAFGSYSYAGSANDWNFSNYRSATVGLSFTMNIFQGGRTNHKVQQDVIAGLQTREQIGDLTDATILKVQSKINELNRVQSQIDAMQKNVILAKRAYQIAEHRFSLGNGSELEVKDANIALSQARVNYSNSIHDYLLANAELDNLLGIVNKKYFKNFNEYLN